MAAHPRSVLLLALLLSSACATRTSAPPASLEPGGACAGEARRPAAAPASDQAVSARLVRALSELREAGKTAAPADLRKQLGRSRVALELPGGGERVLTPAEIYASCGDSVLIFFSVFDCDRCGQRHASAAGGWALTGDGVVVTNHHVVDTFTKKRSAVLGVATRDGRVFPVTEVLAASAADDVALVRVAGAELTPLALSPGDPVGSPVVVISHPKDRFYTLTTGVISRYFRHAHGPHRHGSGKEQPARDPGPAVERVSITAEYAVGSSGAPVLNARGEVTAMVSQTKTIRHPASKEVQMVIRTCVPASRILALIGD